MKVKDIPRLFTPETFCKLVVQAQREAKAAAERLPRRMTERHGEPTAHFAAFSFVDRITEFTPGKGAQGVFHVPAAIRAFPACLVAEAVGQLAAWVSMEHIDYRGRPVAALAGETRFLGRRRSRGHTRTRRRDRRRRRRRGVVSRAGPTCRQARDRTERLPGSHAAGRGVRCTGSAARALSSAARRGRGAGSFPRRRCTGRRRSSSMFPGNRSARTSQIPVSAPFFADHFPRRPVFPATLLLDAQIGLATRLRAKPCRQGRAGPRARAHDAREDARVHRAGPAGRHRAPNSRARRTAATRISLSARDADGKTFATARVEFAAPPHDAMTARKRVAITGIGLVTPVGNDVATTWDAVLHGRSGGAPISVFDASGFPGAHRGGGQEFRRTSPDRRPQAAEAHQSLASLCARGRGTGAAGRRHPPDRSRRDALGIDGRRGHDGRDFADLAGTQGTRPRTASCMPTCC